MLVLFEARHIPAVSAVYFCFFISQSQAQSNWTRLTTFRILVFHLSRPPLHAQRIMVRTATTNGSSITRLGRTDPILLLSRGYTSRWLLPTNNSSNSNNSSSNNTATTTTTTTTTTLQALTADEIDKDLRHMQAYGNAVLQYQQQFYWQVNHSGQGRAPGPNSATAHGAAGSAADGLDHGGTLDSSGGGGGSSGDSGTTKRMANGTAGMSSTAVGNGNNGSSAGGLALLPVRIDPDEEKRLQVLRSKIKTAEILREQAEQEYVAYRAHYVGQQHQTVQQTAASLAVLQWMQELVQKRAATVALQRVRLQITRDVFAALTVRQAVLELPGVAGSLGNGGGGAVPTIAAVGALTTVAPHATRATEVASEMTSQWTALEDEFKAAVIACRQIQNSSASSGAGAGGKKKNGGIVPLKSTVLPATPVDVPLLLSATSKAPEKTLAFKVAGTFGAAQDSLVWMESYLPDNTVEAVQAEKETVDALKEEVEFLQRELQGERAASQGFCQQTSNFRAQQDEWVAMIGLVRQETESVLHRHHILLESDVAVAASERLQEKAELELEDANGGAELEEAGAMEENVPSANGDEDDAGVPAVVAAVDEANDGDDEVSSDGEEEDELLQGNAAGWEGAAKRAVEDREGMSPSGRKRRKL